jgi:hypothetical protein
MTTKKLYDKWEFVYLTDEAGEAITDDDQWYVELFGGKYDKVVYSYTNVVMNEENREIKFNYELHRCIDDDPHGTDEFNDVVGEILNLILEDAFEAGDFKMGDNDERITNNPS